MPSIEDQPVTFAAGAAAANTSFSWWGLFGTILVFVLILALALWVIRRLNRAQLRSLATPWARVLDRQLLSAQQSLYLVEIAGKLQVLAGSDHHLVKVADIDDPETAAEILEEIANRSPAPAQGFLGGAVRRLFRGSRRQAGSFSSELERMLEEVEK